MNLKQKTIDMHAEGHRVDAAWAEARAELAMCEARLSYALATYASTGTDLDLAICRSRFEDCKKARLAEAQAIVEFDAYHFTMRLARVGAHHAMVDE
jgi:hypothetical protein